LPSASAHDPAPNGETGGTIEPRTGEEGAAHDDYDIRPGRRRGGPSLQPVLLAQQDGARAYFVSTSQAPAACTDYRLDMGLLVLSAFTISGAVDFVRRGQAHFAAAVAGGTIALCGYSVLTHGWL